MASSQTVSLTLNFEWAATRNSPVAGRRVRRRAPDLDLQATGLNKSVLPIGLEVAGQRARSGRMLVSDGSESEPLNTHKQHSHYQYRLVSQCVCVCV